MNLENIFKQKNEIKKISQIFPYLIKLIEYVHQNNYDNIHESNKLRSLIVDTIHDLPKEIYVVENDIVGDILKTKIPINKIRNHIIYFLDYITSVHLK